MENAKILFDPTPEVPVSIQMFSFDCDFKHSHPQTELFFVISGSTNVLIEDKTYRLKPEDVFIVNANARHYFNIKKCKFLVISFNLLNIVGINQKHLPYFELNSSGNTESTKYNYIRYLVAQLVKVNSSGENKFMTLSLLYALIGQLLESFLSVSDKTAKPSGNLNMFYTITEYIIAHYTERLSLNILAEQFNLSVPYLSSCFKKYMNTTFLSYYNEIRLSHAVNDILTSDDSLENIALENGFRDSRTFVALFKKKYHELPSLYRKKHKMNTTSDIYQTDAIDTDLIIGIESLVKYLNFYNNSSPLALPSEETSANIDAGTVDYQFNGVPLQHNFKKFCCIGSARQFLYADIQEMLRLSQADIGYEYVKFHGILSDEMMVYTEDEFGTPYYSFILVDKVLDFILSVNLKPLIQLSFMPRQLASAPEKMIDMGNFNTSSPKDINKWVDLVTATIEHIVKRYGLEIVRSWLFCVWNEPDAPTNSFGWEDPYLFYEFYRRTYAAVKSIDSHLTFGTPSLLLAPNSETPWEEEFFQYCNDYDCRPDFINIHYYDNSFHPQSTLNAKDHIAQTFQLSNMASTYPLSEDPFAFTKFISGIKYYLKKYQMGSLPIYLTEWNLTISHRDPINDTCFKACYIIKNLLQNYDRLDSFGYWCLTDFHEELQLPNELFHGGLGMFTYNGIPKSHYNGFKFLTQLGDEMIATGNGYFITKTPSRIIMILYNYEHYSKLFASGILFDIDKQDRYAPFTKMQTANFLLTLKNLPTHGCLIKEMFINQENGSSYDAWTRMGAQALTTISDLNILLQESQPSIYLHRQTVDNGTLTLQTTLAPLEVRLVEINFDK